MAGFNCFINKEEVLREYDQFYEEKYLEKALNCYRYSTSILYKEG
jgi:hypothetical protein